MGSCGWTVPSPGRALAWHLPKGGSSFSCLAMGPGKAEQGQGGCIFQSQEGGSGTDFCCSEVRHLFGSAYNRGSLNHRTASTRGHMWSYQKQEDLLWLKMVLLVQNHTYLSSKAQFHSPCAHTLSRHNWLLLCGWQGTVTQLGMALKGSAY